MQESEKHGRDSNDEFLRVLFWQFHSFRMLLGSDLMLFSNEKYVAVSLHLWDVTRQVGVNFCFFFFFFFFLHKFHRALHPCLHRSLH